MELSIKGKRVLVTGASQGIGLGIAQAFAQEGCCVTVVARREEKLKAIVDSLAGSAGDHDYYAADLMEPNCPTRVAQALLEKHGVYDIVVHNVGGTLQVRDPLSGMEQWQKVWNYNVGIAIEMNAILVPPMQEQQWGRVIHISSIAAEQLLGCGPYGAAKAYLNAYTKILGRAMAASGIVVSAIAPGAIYAKDGHWDWVKTNRPENLEDFLERHQATKRLGTPEEIASFALFLASDHATFAQGAVIPVDGGTM